MRSMPYRGRFVVGLLLSSVASQQLPCEPALQYLTVASTSDAFKLSEALNCSDGEFVVEWNGHVLVKETIATGSKTSLNVTGGMDGSSAVVDGGGTTRLFQVRGGELHLSDLQISYGYADVGGAVQLISGNLSWIGQVLFSNNTAVIGGAIGCLECTMKGDGESIFFNNNAGEDAGAIWIEGGNMLAGGSTSFVANTAERAGGALFATHNANVEFSGTTTATGNSAEYGGAFAIGWEEVGFGNVSMSLQGNADFEDNSAIRNGGAVIISEGSVLQAGAGSTGAGRFSFASNVAGEDGGAIGCYYSTLMVTGEAEFFDNSATGEDAGALRVKGGTYVAVGSTTFSHNTAVRGGGAVFITHEAEVNITGIFYAADNSAQYGGAFMIAWRTHGGEAIVRWQGNATFERNKATADGGAMWIGDVSYGSWNGSIIFADNVATGDGGAVAIGGDSVLYTHAGSRGGFFRNIAYRSGGAVYSTGNGEGQNYDGLIFEDNHGAAGGAIASYGTGHLSASNFTNCRFMGNSALLAGGAVESGFAYGVFRDTWFENNSADSGGALRLVSGTAWFENVNFRQNWVSAEGPAVLNLGFIDSMTDVVFDDNFFRCNAGEYMEYIEVEGNGSESTSARFGEVCDGCPEDVSTNSIVVKDPSVIHCSPALEHTHAGVGATVETLDVDSGYWRASNTSKEILECFNTEACRGGQTGGRNFCEDGYTGPYCSVCGEDPGTLPYTCTTCSESDRAVAAGVAAVVTAFAVTVVVMVAANLMSTESRETRKGRLHARLFRALPLQSLKILIVIWQILTQFSEVANVSFPDTYDRFLSVVNVINFDVGSVVSAGCLWSDFDHHDRLFVSTVSPLVVLVLLAVTCTTTLKRTEASPSGHARTRVLNIHTSAVLLLTFFVYSSVSTNIFRMFACESLDDGNTYLRADYRIQCDSPKHLALQRYAGIMILVYPVGIPVLYSVLLYRLRDVIMTSGPYRGDNWRARATSGLRAPYRLDRYYYEVIECMRRVMLTGVVVFIYPGDAAQIVITVVIAFVFFAVSESLLPYESDSDMWLSRGGHVVVFFSFFAALLYKVDVSDERDTSQEAFGVALIAVHVCLIALVVSNGVAIWFASRNQKLGKDFISPFQQEAEQLGQNEEQLGQASYGAKSSDEAGAVVTHTKETKDEVCL